MLELTTKERARIGAICGLYYGDRISTAEVARRLSDDDCTMPEHEAYNVIANHGEAWKARFA